MPNDDEVPKEILIRGTESDDLTVEQLANFLRDLVFLHDHLWLMASPDYKEYNLNHSFFYSRYGRPVPQSQRLHLLSVEKKSPFELQLGIPSAFYFVPVAMIFFRLLRGAILLPGELEKQDADIQFKREATENMSLRNEKLRSEVTKREQKLDLDVSMSAQEETDIRALPGALADDYEERIHLIKRDVRRLANNEIQVKEVTVIRYVKVGKEKKQ
jgi:hypothetical protein